MDRMSTEMKFGVVEWMKKIPRGMSIDEVSKKMSQEFKVQVPSAYLVNRLAKMANYRTGRKYVRGPNKSGQITTTKIIKCGCGQEYTVKMYVYKKGVKVETQT